jgi:hypothetical protein
LSEQNTRRDATAAQYFFKWRAILKRGRISYRFYKIRKSIRGDVLVLDIFGGAMDILLAVLVVVLPSALAVTWLVWHSGNFDVPRQRH